MALNDSNFGEFSTELEDEWMFDAHNPPGYEIGAAVEIEPDNGSGSYAEDGPIEVAEDKVMTNGEDQIGSYAMYGPTEIGSGPYAQAGATEIGAGLASEEGQSEIGTGLASEEGQSEIGVGLASEEGQSEIGTGHYPIDGASEIGAGHYPIDGASEIGAGHYPIDGASEIGNMSDVMNPAHQADLVGDWYPGHDYAIEVGADEQKVAVAKVIEKARDNRQPPPPMAAVHPDEPEAVDELSDWLTDTFLGAAAATGSPDPFPLTTKFLQRAGATTEPRIVRVDTEESYREFRRENSPELAELRDMIEDHIADPIAHGGDEDSLQEDIDDLVILGEQIEDGKRVDLWMPKAYDGLLTAWTEDDFVCVSLKFPGKDGEVRICTSFEPIRKCVAEMSRHASEAGVPARAVVGAIGEMGCVLGAGTVIKEVAAAAPSILNRPEAQAYAPFVVRIEPKLAPSIAALGMLLVECRRGNAQAVAEWKKLGEIGAPPVKQAMAEALALVKKAE